MRRHDLYRTVDPDSIGSYDELLVIEPLPGDEFPATWRGCLRDWALAQLDKGTHRFGRYIAAVVPVDEEGRPDEEQMDDLIEQDINPVEEQVCWSG